ncbi:hypothetical protein PF010_g11499 [Phytophthora fragariae]|nr:hypothetical protein PF009_g6535 [Phytophthora fragariae]KAE9109553.1 hypothetical protein PF010_g11499 [Phytophthora fragariae]KAE9244541.1 hypothetical protein PF002_g7699 [Phytophthora fragariae]
MNRGQPQGSSGTNRGQQQNAGGGNGYSPRNPRACYMCKATDHGVSDCPLMSMLRNMAGQNASGTTRVQGQVPSPQRWGRRKGKEVSRFPLVKGTALEGASRTPRMEWLVSSKES